MGGGKSAAEGVSVAEGSDRGGGSAVDGGAGGGARWRRLQWEGRGKVFIFKKKLDLDHPI